MSRRMKQLKSTYRDLHDLFGRDINATHILEQLRSCHAEESAAAVRQRMEKLDFDVMGIEDKGEVDGYVERSSPGTETKKWGIVLLRLFDCFEFEAAYEHAFSVDLHYVGCWRS